MLVQPGTAPGRPGLGRIPAVPIRGIVALDFFTADLLNGTKIYVLSSSSMAPAASGSSEPPSSRSSPG